ncbi:MAG TPA: hypothetical protein VJT73_11445, partial [Polyangiaceae bacterium]|nr:hypothetical protein [Polyangiaceae bacterium]
LPPLSGPLAASRYVASGRAGTGPSLLVPLSEVNVFTSTSESFELDTFVPVPLLDYPARGASWNGRRLSYSYGPSTRTVDLTLVKVQGGGGYDTWTVAAPGGARSITLPDLATAFPEGALSVGPVSINVYGAQVEAFDYSRITYRQLAESGFDAYSLDVFPARIE